MNKYSVNYSQLQESLRPKRPVFKYADVKDRLVKVAFDVVRFMDTDNIDGLWQIQKTDDGEVIVAMYEDNLPTQEKTSTASDWSAMTDLTGNINVFYKDSPVTKVSLASLGLENEKPESVCKVLSEKLALNKNLQRSFLGYLPKEDREVLLRAYPELKG